MILVGPDCGRKEATTLIIDMGSQPTQSMTFNTLTQSIHVATLTSHQWDYSPCPAVHLITIHLDDDARPKEYVYSLLNLILGNNCERPVSGPKVMYIYMPNKNGVSMRLEQNRTCILFGMSTPLWWFVTTTASQAWSQPLHSLWASPQSPSMVP